MILTTKRDMGFIRHDSLNWKIILKKGGAKLCTQKRLIFLSTLSNYDIPPKVAPQQSFSPLFVTVDTKINLLNYFLTLIFPHLVISYNNVVNENHESASN